MFIRKFAVQSEWRLRQRGMTTEEIIQRILQWVVGGVWVVTAASCVGAVVNRSTSTPATTEKEESTWPSFISPVRPQKSIRHDGDRWNWKSRRWRPTGRPRMPRSATSKFAEHAADFLKCTTENSVRFARSFRGGDHMLSRLWPDFRQPVNVLERPPSAPASAEQMLNGALNIPYSTVNATYLYYEYFKTIPSYHCTSICCEELAIYLYPIEL